MKNSSLPTLPEHSTTQAGMSEEHKRNIGTINKWLPTWFWNMRKTIPIIDRIFAEHGDRNSVEALPTWFKEGKGNGCALILGSGPSLELLTREHLTAWKGLVIAGASNASIPAALGRPADLIFAVDAAVDTVMQLKWLGSSLSHSSSRLVTCPYIHPDVISFTFLIAPQCEQTFCSASYFLSQ